MKIYLKSLLVILLCLSCLACSETTNSPRRLSRDSLPDNRPINAGFLQSDSEKSASQVSLNNLAPWFAWSKGKTISDSKFSDSKIAQIDQLIEDLNFDQALQLIGQVKTENFDEEESLVVRKASLLLLTSKTTEAILNLSRFYQNHKFTEEKVSAPTSLLFGYAYGQARNYEQALAWFSQATLSSDNSVKNRTAQGLKSLLSIMPNPILEQGSFTWRNNTEVAKLISEERFLRQSRDIVRIPSEAFFWIPEFNGHSFSVPSADQVAAEFTHNGAKKIAALLPLSGKFNKMGSALQHGMELAAQHSQTGSQPLEIVFIDSEDTQSQENFGKRVTDVSQSGAEVLVGPLVSEKAQEVEQIARTNSLPAVILSKGGNAILGQGVYRFGLTNESQAESLIAVLSEQRANLRVALLYPDDEFGLGFSAAVKEALASRNLSPIYDLSYPKGNQTLMNEKAKEFGSNPPEIIIFADNIKASAQFMSELNSQLKKIITPVGSALWDNPLELIQSKIALSKAVFVSTFYPDLNDQKVAQFVNDFKTRFNKSPDFFAAQGYDLAMLISQSGFSSGQIDFPASANGVTGLAQPTSYGEINRKLRVLQLRKGTIEPFVALQAERTITSVLADAEATDIQETLSDPVVSE